jgi:polysaccharide export outer membrane protein
VTAHAQVDEYVLQAGDVIQINVAEHPEFSGQHRIRPDGRINFPVVGELDVAMLTCAQLVKIMQGKLSAYVNNPVVSVAIESYYANKVYAIGGVRKPGQYQIYEPIDVMNLIAMAGGLRSRKARRLKIIRQDGTVVNINMREFWGDDLKRETGKYMLYPGDTMYAPIPFTMPWAMIATILGIVNIALVILINSNRVGNM